MSDFEDYPVVRLSIRPSELRLSGVDSIQARLRTIGTPGPPGPAGPVGSTILGGQGPPEDEGSDGDFYLDLESGDLYGPKDETWPEPISLMGPPGTAGDRGSSVLSGNGAPDDSVGLDGDFYIDTSSQLLYGPKSGTWGGSVSLVGSAGEQGLQGPPGPVSPMRTPSGSHLILPQSFASAVNTVALHGSVGAANNTGIWLPFVITETTTIDMATAEITSNSSTGTIRVGIYSDSDGLPSEVLVDMDTVPSTTTGAKSWEIDPLTLPPGYYWICIVGQDLSGATPTFRSISAGTPIAHSSTAAFGSTAAIPMFRSSPAGSTVGALKNDPVVAAWFSNNHPFPLVRLRVV